MLDSRYNYNVAHSNGNSYSTVAIPLPDGTYLYSLLTHQNAYDDPVLNVLDSIKIDGVMWKNAPELVKALKEITDKKGIKLIAEKVETKKELNKLLDLGITHFQGWYFNGVDNN
ncbi:MAG: EAL domain-containing protein [Caldimicrobium sp.]